MHSSLRSELKSIMWEIHCGSQCFLSTSFLNSFKLFGRRIGDQVNIMESLKNLVYFDIIVKLRQCKNNKHKTGKILY